MRVNHSVLDPPKQRILHILDRTSEVMLELVLELGGNGSRDRR
jgi:hypothetical protein